jgi:hypothetical protein
MNLTPHLRFGGLVVFCGPQAVTSVAHRLLAGLVLRGAVHVLDAGNRLQPYALIEHLRQHTPEVATISQRLHLRRVFTAHQVLDALASSPASPTPLVILDLLATFYDETLPMPQARSLLGRCLAHLRRLTRTSPLFVFLVPPPHLARRDLLDAVCQHATTLFFDPEPLPTPSQASLW